MTAVTIYHNPRCSKSRQTLALLEEQANLDIQIVEYLKAPPDLSTLEALGNMLGCAPREFMRTKEAVYKEKHLGDPGISDDTLRRAIVEEPILLERPIVVYKGKAKIGRPPEQVLELF